MSVGCSADIPPLSVARPDDPSEEDVAEDDVRVTIMTGNSNLQTKDARKWLGSPALYRIDNYSASLLVEEAISAAEKDIIEVRTLSRRAKGQKIERK